MSEVVRVFNSTTRQEHADKYYSIRIGDKTNIVEGYLSSNFSYNVSPQWEQLINFNGKFKFAENVLSYAGLPAFASGFLTKKYYKGGSWISFPVEFRIVDDQGIGSVEKAGVFLTDSVLPVRLDRTVVKAALGKVIPQAKKGFDIAFENLSESQKKLWDILSKTGSLAAAIKAAGGELSFDGSDLLVLYDLIETGSNSIQSGGVKDVEVEIGNFYKGNLIITDVSITYSKELTHTTSGRAVPLYGDFRVTFQTRDIPEKGSLGDKFFSNQGRNRVSREP